MEVIDEGFPDWTELGQDSGLDPLGMQRPIEAIYQSLIPGISTITLRYRYYSFFPFILKHYEDTIRNPDPAVFRAFYRRCEVLYALICTHEQRELGITGSDWAEDILGKQATGGVKRLYGKRDTGGGDLTAEARCLVSVLRRSLRISYTVTLMDMPQGVIVSRF